MQKNVHSQVRDSRRTRYIVGKIGPATFGQYFSYQLNFFGAAIVVNAATERTLKLVKGKLYAYVVLQVNDLEIFSFVC